MRANQRPHGGMSNFRSTLSTAGNSMTDIERPSLEPTILPTPTPHSCKKICPQNMPYNGDPYGIKVS